MSKVEDNAWLRESRKKWDAAAKRYYQNATYTACFNNAKLRKKWLPYERLTEYERDYWRAMAQLEELLKAEEESRPAQTAPQGVV